MAAPPDCAMHRVVFLAVAALLIGMLSRAAPIQAQSQPPIADITVFYDAEFVQVDSVTPPVEAAWERVALPDSWSKSKRPRNIYGWYRLRFEHNLRTAGQQALYIPRITNNVEVFLNGSSFAVSGRLALEPEATWNRAQYFLVPSSLFKPGANELLIRLHPDGYERAGLSTVCLGDAAVLNVPYQRRFFIQTAAPQLISGLLGVMAAFSLAIWARRRDEAMFLFFGLMSLVAILRLSHYYLRDTPLWLALTAVPALAWLTTLQLQFTLRFAAYEMRRFERALLIFAAVVTVAFVVIPVVTPSAYGAAIGVLYAVLTLLSPILLGVAGYALLRARSAENYILLAALVLNTVLGAHDSLAYRELLGFDQPYLLPLGMPMILFAVAALLVKRFVATLSGYETLNADLAERVAQRERELQASFEQVRQLDQQRATAEERQRLMRDMHDGIGSHLMSTLALARMGTLSQQELSEILADCIDELKMTIDSLEPVESDLLVVLGNLRYRLEPRLNAAGITLEWAVNDLPPLPYLDPENVRSVLRIVQEAFTNTLKHSHAKRITLSTGVDIAGNRVLVRLTDDGNGNCAAENKHAGRGIDNMKNRAAKLGGQIEVIPLRGGGTCVNLYLPLSRR
ncbi:MAG TPA: ATP-binding protein [Usitatibacteraceae bacterium]